MKVDDPNVPPLEVMPSATELESGAPATRGADVTQPSAPSLYGILEAIGPLIPLTYRSEYLAQPRRQNPPSMPGDGDVD